ncbi:adenosylcobinamide-GDP ribazoletransferase, partial [Klebsiella pneumoniae]|uniref:adenosylcobinamide-GDP ribazoletransferase n=1 Tax=Klebsiella pneumoniae TaxID=573 RepID=UPI0038550623
MGQPTPQSVTIAIALCLALTVALLASSFTALATLTALIVVACVIFAFGRLASAQIGGQTGDVVGAAQVLAEIAFLAG